jgi:V8-like Glu-specific endopeptidase
MGMMRSVAALVAIGVSLLAATAARAAEPAGVSARSVSQSRDAVTTYWTPARMRRAEPAAPAQAPTAGAVQAPAFTAGEYPGDYTVPPASTHGKVFFTSRGTDYVCSGTALASQNRSVVWTAGHCVNDGPGAFHTNWAFVPAYRDGARPLGTWTARRLLTTDGWGSRGDLGVDLGAAIVSTTAAGALTDRVGGRAIAFNYDRNQTFSSFGYPAGAPFTGGRLWVCQSPLAGSDPSTSPATMAIGCDMTSGSSGGSWVVGSSVYSVNSYGYAADPQVLYGPYQGAAAQALFASAQAG